MLPSVRCAAPSGVTLPGRPGSRRRKAKVPEWKAEKNDQSDTVGVLEWLMLVLIYGSYILINSFLFQWPQCVSGNEIHMLTRCLSDNYHPSFFCSHADCFCMENNYYTVTVKMADGGIWRWASRHSRRARRPEGDTLPLTCILRANFITSNRNMLCCSVIPLWGTGGAGRCQRRQQPLPERIPSPCVALHDGDRAFSPAPIRLLGVLPAADLQFCLLPIRLLQLKCGNFHCWLCKCELWEPLSAGRFGGTACREEECTAIMLPVQQCLLSVRTRLRGQAVQTSAFSLTWRCLQQVSWAEAFHLAICPGSAPSAHTAEFFPSLPVIAVFFYFILFYFIWGERGA